MDDEIIIHYDRIIHDGDGLKAVLYEIDGDEYWIPKSVHTDFEDGSLAVETWWARKEGL